METKVDDSLNYDAYVLQYGTYQLLKINQTSGFQGVTLSVAGGEESEFEIPAKVFNLSKTKIQFTLTPASPPVAAVSYNWMFAEEVPIIRQIQFYTRSGTYFVNVPNCNKYLNMILRRETKLEDLLKRDKTLVVTGATASGVLEGLQPCNSLFNANFRPTAGVTGITSYLEPQYVIIGSATTVAGPVYVNTPQLNYTFDLSLFKNTLFELNKDLYFGGETVYIKIIWDSITKMLFTSTATDATAAGAASATVSAGAPAGGTLSGQISNLRLYLAVETNPEIVNKVVKQCSEPSGLQILIPYV